MRRRGFGVALAAGLLAGCVTRTHRFTPPGTATALGAPTLIQDLVRQALVSDAAGDHAADTLYAPSALVVANARVRLAAPRFAGVGSGGRITVAAAAVTLEGHLAWSVVDYRWVDAPHNLAEAGRATFVCEQLSRGWKIVHVHSSQQLPWDR
jgi:SnoaL-like domain